jgi:uncharacterized protein YcbX
MIVAELWRYPVKSMQGERRDSIELGEKGIRGDRRYGVLDLGTGTVISAKRDGRLLQAVATLEGGELAITLPTGKVATGTGPGVDAALSDWLDQPVRLVEALADSGATYERQVDFEDDESGSSRWQGVPGSFVDQSPTHVLTTASLRGLKRERPDLIVEVRRFRPNVVVDADGDEFVEQGWIGSSLAFAGVRLAVHKTCSRCVVTTRAQPGGVTRQLDVLRHLNHVHEGNLGVRATVAQAGRITVGEPVAVAAG